MGIAQTQESNYFVDPDNPIIQLCVKGMQAEGAGRHEEARLLFVQAWEQSQNEYEACIAAHYVARQQSDAHEALKWNQEALNRAGGVKESAVEAFYPSLYLNLGKSHEDLGNREEASRFYRMAENAAGSLSSDRYGQMVRDGIRRGLQRVA